MFNKFLPGLVALLMASVAGPALAAVVTFTGKLDDPANPALVASNMGAAQFTDDRDTANNVALYTVHVTVGGNVNIASTGFALGGIAPYFTLFSGTDPASATFRESNYLHAVIVGGDFTQDIVLTAGDYTLAIGVFENMSFAENLGTGILADGFTGVRGPTSALGARIFINHPVLAYFGPGDSPRGVYHVNGSGDTMSGGALMMVTGYFVNLP